MIKDMFNKFKQVSIPYQQKAALKMAERSLYYRDNSIKGNNYFVLSMPTGSGKTFTDYLYIKELFKQDPNSIVVFLTVGSGELHNQSYNKLKQYSNNKLNIFSIPEIMLLKSVESHSVFVMNWESLNKTNQTTNEIISVFNKDYHESKTTYPMLCEMMKDKNVYLIIDESHLSAASLKSEHLIKQLNPVIQINQSATPSFTPSTYDDFFEVSLDEVKRYEVIVKGFKIQYGFKKNQILSIETMIQKSLELSFEIQDASKKENAEFLPLIAIQIPNGEEGSFKLKELKTILEKQGISEKNGDLLVHLNDEKTSDDLFELDSPTSKVRVLIFKQAIATGWDCSRAKIWIKLRDIKKESFNIQTGGRFLRTIYKSYFKNDLLNYAYLFTDQDNYSYDESFFIPNKEYSDSLEINLNPNLKFDDYILPNSFKSRENDYKDYKSDIFKHVFEKFLKNMNINSLCFSKENIEKLKQFGFQTNLNKTRNILGQSEQSLEDFIHQKEIVDSKKIKFEMSSNEPTQKLKMLFKVDYCHDFSYERSFKSFLSSVNKLASVFYNDDQIFQMHCLLSDNHNWVKFCELTKNDLIKYQNLRNQESQKINNIHDSIFQMTYQRTGSSLNNLLVPVKNSIYGVLDNQNFIPSIIVSKRGELKHSDSQIEQNFLNYWNTQIQNDGFLLFRNGTSNEQDFRISYFDEISKKEKGFFPDLILIKKTKKGYTSIISDIKSESELKNIMENNELFSKQKALFEYSKEYSNDEHLILAGIIIEAKSSNGLSSFKIFDKNLSIKELNKGDFSSGVDLSYFLTNLSKKKVA